jgi:hypothetical protein
MTGSRIPAGQRTVSVFDFISAAIDPPFTNSEFKADALPVLLLHT